MVKRDRALIEGIRMATFENVYNLYKSKSLDAKEASELLGCSVRHFYRLRKGYDAHGIDALRDGRLGRESPHKAADAEVEAITRLYQERYRDFSVAHFHDFARQNHGLTRSYSWTNSLLKREGLVEKSNRGGPHRLRRARRPMRGMMVHQDGSKHEWIQGVYWDLIITLDDATSDILSGFFVQEEGTDSSFRGIYEVIENYGIFCSFYTDRGSHYFTTPESGGPVDKQNLTQVGRALKQLRIQHIAAYSPQARGRSERAFGTIQDRLVPELKIAGITDMDQANRYLREVYIPSHNAKFGKPPASDKSAFVPALGLDLKNILCKQEERKVQNDNTVRIHGQVLQIPPYPERHHFVKAQVQVNTYPDGSKALFYGPLCIGEYHADGSIKP